MKRGFSGCFGKSVNSKSLKRSFFCLCNLSLWIVFLAATSVSFLMKWWKTSDVFIENAVLSCKCWKENVYERKECKTKKDILWVQHSLFPITPNRLLELWASLSLQQSQSTLNAPCPWLWCTFSDPSYINESRLKAKGISLHNTHFNVHLCLLNGLPALFIIP